MTKNELQQALALSYKAFATQTDKYDAAAFEAMPNGKWSVGQQLEHLYRAISPVALALALPKFVLRMLFGKANRSSKTYQGLIEKYQSKLANGAVATGVFVPPSVSFSKKETLLKKYNKTAIKMVARLKNWTEEDLDTYIVPHPILGKLTMREMLFFTNYHALHHLKIIEGYNF